MGYFENEMQKRFALANKIAGAKYDLLAIAIHGLKVLRVEGNKIAILTLEEMAKTIPEDLEIDVLKHITKTLDADDDK